MVVQSLNYEIRLRKLTFTEVKADCALFKQKKLFIVDKERNLESLIDTQLEFRTMADMSNLESAIMGNVDVCDLDEIAEDIQPNISEGNFRRYGKMISGHRKKDSSFLDYLLMEFALEK